MPTRIVKYAPCGQCGESVPRDDMLGITVLLFRTPDDRTKIPIRLCPECFEAASARFESQRWDNSSMIEVEEQLLAHA